MNKVAIVGYGNTKFSSDDVPVEQKLLESTKMLFDNTSNLDQKDIDVVLVASNDNKKYLSPILSELSGIEPKISHTVENLCNSGTNSIVAGLSYIASGLAETALVVGGDRYDSPGQILDWDLARGEFKHPIFWASIFTKAYKRQFKITDEDLAYVSAKNHKNASDNPYAYSNKKYSIDEILNSKKLTEDLRLLDCSKPCTGSSAILLTAEDNAKKITDVPVWITGIGQKTNSAGFTKTSDFSRIKSTEESAKMAYQMANIDASKIDVAEIHDAFSVCEPMALDALGISQLGKGAEYSKNLFKTENKKINPRGGLIGTGHPLAATGIAQTIEIAQQIQGCAKNRQIENTNLGLVHNMSAAGTSSTILILES